MGVLDSTACALFADFENKGRQDLLVVCGSGPLFSEPGGRDICCQARRVPIRRVLRRERSRMRLWLTTMAMAASIFTSACTATTWGSTSITIRFPTSMRGTVRRIFCCTTKATRTFVDRTEAAGLNAENDRYSFACAWGACGRQAVYPTCTWPTISGAQSVSQQGDGTFSADLSEAHVQ